MEKCIACLKYLNFIYFFTYVLYLIFVKKQLFNLLTNYNKDFNAKRFINIVLNVFVIRALKIGEFNFKIIG